MAFEANEKNDQQQPEHSVSALHQDLMSTDQREALRIVQAQRSSAQSTDSGGPGGSKSESGDHKTQPSEQKTQPSDQKPAAGATSADSTKNGNAACKESKDYMAFIESAAETMYDPQKLGDLPKTLHKYDCEIKNTDDAVKKAEEVLAGTGDHYNHILSAKELAELQGETKGNYSGIGVEIVGAIPGKTDYPQIRYVVEGSPAEHAGVHKNDLVTAVDGKDTKGMTTAEVTDALLGQPHTKVDLTISRSGQELHDDIERDKVVTHAVRDSKDLGDGIAYISIHDFANEHTAQELQQALEKFPNAKGFVIDVRDNPGGLVDQAVQSSELFINHGVIMKERQRGLSEPTNPQYIEQTFGVTDKQAYQKVGFSDDPDHPTTRNSKRLPNVVNGRPVVLLTNEDSASAAEIFTGALHDTAHVTTLGDKTFGKGIGQIVMDHMPQGTALKVTSLHYTTPSGEWPGDADQHRIGLKPDVPVANPKDAEPLSPQDAQLQAAVDLLKKKFQP